LAPDLTLLLRLDPATGRARQAVRGEAPDRLELSGEAFFDRIAAAYDALAAAEPRRIRVLNASAPPSDVLSEALDAISDVRGPGNAG
jgi:dTMP kinase